ncbi:MAG: penicillin-binding transpeptidase domain-containing protein [Lachnospiraceae bacterium]|nr:penicillin-binding transpeptidase domain-containing protein [Lachnospiraceae bacterium]
MKKKKSESNQSCRELTPEEEFLQKEKERSRNNRIKNRPILVMTYSIVTIFMCMIGYIIYFMSFRAEQVIANSRNLRQDSFADVVERGDIITSDGEVIATSTTDEEGNTYRSYPYNNMFAHVVGYEGRGKAGLELSGNFYMLRSHINIFERVYMQLSEEKNRGDNVITTVSYKLQSAAYNAMGGCNGAVVAIEPSTGKILVMISKPDYNPNNMDNVWAYLDSEEGRESSILLNRATQGMYAPGSTFKIVTLLSYIRENPDYTDYTYTCNGSEIFNGVDIHCSNDRVHGTVSIGDSLAYSCNGSFATMGTSLDYGKYRDTAEELLFNCELPYDGIYNKSYFEISKNSRSDEIPQTAIGQGNTQITPLHNAMIVSAIANGGVLMKPYLIDRIENDDGAKVKKFGSKTYGNLMTNKEAQILTDYMKGVCSYGTASGYFSGTPYEVAGKTGTAEYDNQGHCNSWFVGFSNPDNPDLVVSVIMEDYSTYGITGASVAKAIFDAYYQ